MNPRGYVKSSGVNCFLLGNGYKARSLRLKRSVLPDCCGTDIVLENVTELQSGTESNICHLLVSISAIAAGFCAVLVRLALCFTPHALISRNLATARIENKKEIKTNK